MNTSQPPSSRPSAAAPERALRLGDRDRAEGLERLAERADRARDEARSTPDDLARGARDLHALAGDEPHLLLEAVSREADRVRAECVGLDQLGAGGEVVAVDRLDQLRLSRG